MRWMDLRRDILFAVVILSAGSCLASDSYLSGFTTDNSATIDFGQPGTAISNSGIDRLLEVNATHDSLLGSSRGSNFSEPVASESSAVEIVPIADVTSTTGRGMYVVAGCVAAFALGLGLCFAGMMTGRKRTINTFTAGFVRIR